MKKIIYIAFPVMMVLIFGCNSKAKKEEVKEEEAIQEEFNSEPDEEEPVEVIEDNVEAEVEMNQSDLHFLQALDAFRNNDKALCAKRIQQGIKAFKNETADEKGKTKALVEIALNKLNGLDEKVENGQVKDIAVLEEAFNSAERANLHMVLVEMDDIFIPEPNLEEKSKLKETFSNALHKLHLVINKGNSEAKVEGQQILKAGESIEAKMKRGAKVTEKEIKDFTHAAKLWVENNP